MTSPKRKILFSGMIAADPAQGGATWAILQYLLGLQRLGHEVWFVEPVKQDKLRPSGCILAESANARYFQKVVAEFGLEHRSSLLLADTPQTIGLPYDELRHIAAAADVLINVSGMLADEALTTHIPVRVFLDLDPAFVQVWNANYGIDLGFARHTHFVTVGKAIVQPSCPVPTCGLEWITTFQPVSLDDWPLGETITYDGLTTIGHWRGYGSVEHQGVHYGQKAHSFRQFFRLPTLTSEPIMPALAIHPGEAADLAALRANKWRLLDPDEVANSPAKYQNFVRGSKAELGIAKSGYVASRCAWFSDRSVCYLAAGRPVIGQETGFGEFLPTGAGLFSFATLDAALACIDQLNADYARHRRAARTIAEEFFDANHVLARLLQALEA